MELLKIDLLDSEIPQALLRCIRRCNRTETLRDRRIAARPARCDSSAEFWSRRKYLWKAVADRLPNQLLAVPVAISERRVDEIHAQFERPLQRSHRFVVSAALPLIAADAPSAISDLADFRFRRAQFSIMHDFTLSPAEQLPGRTKNRKAAATLCDRGGL